MLFHWEYSLVKELLTLNESTFQLLEVMQPWATGTYDKVLGKTRKFSVIDSLEGKKYDFQ